MTVSEVVINHKEASNRIDLVAEPTLTYYYSLASVRFQGSSSFPTAL